MSVVGASELSEACWLMSWQKAPCQFQKIYKCFRAFATRGKAVQGAALGLGKLAESWETPWKVHECILNSQHSGLQL
jgi:hypothetical protein